MADAVHMPCQQMAIQRLSEPQRRLEIDASPNREFSEGRDGERRQRHVRVEALSARLDDGQAHPIDGNAVALLQRGQAGILGIDSQTVVAANIGLIDDLSYATDNAGEHAY